jgi:Methylase involved in ubiquinone/menaquinone biosynthesis
MAGSCQIVIRGDFFVADVSATGLPADNAHAVVNIDVVQLLDDPRALIVEAARVLRPGGRFVLSDQPGWSVS